MKRGDVVNLKSCRVYSGKNWMEFKPLNKGETFVFVMLGVESDDKPLDPVAAIEALGWRRAVPATATVDANEGTQS